MTGTIDTYHEAERERALAELRVVRIEAQLFLAHVDHLGLLLKDNLIRPAGARAALADLTGTGSREAAE